MEKIVPLFILLLHSSNTKHLPRNEAFIITFFRLDLILTIFNFLIIVWCIFFFTFRFLFTKLIHNHGPSTRTLSSNMPTTLTLMTNNALAM